jgi:hypothetical protein
VIHLASVMTHLDCLGEGRATGCEKGRPAGGQFESKGLVPPTAIHPEALPRGGRHASLHSPALSLFQLRVLRLGLLQDGDIGVGVLPKGEEVAICGPRFSGVT